MKFGETITDRSVRHPWLVTLAMVLSTLVLALLAVLPTVWPHVFPGLPPLKVDTDPENMLPADEPVRVFHNEMKREMGIHDIVVLGIVNEADPNGVFNPQSLRRIYELTQFIKGEDSEWKTSHPEYPRNLDGVVEVDLIAPSVVDVTRPEQPGVIRFEWLMAKPPETQPEALAIRDKAARIPFLNGSLVSEDGRAICLYVPLKEKDQSSEIRDALLERIAAFGKSDDQFHITGLPVAEDTFGVEMFKQMAISAPVAMGVIFVLMLIFFRKLVLVISPMIVAMVSVIATMGLLVATGHTVHIMSSMIPIFIMPIAVLDAVHILSDFFDRYQETKDRRKTIHAVMKTLLTPMLYTSLTTAVGFASLALTPIPPVQVFGLFIAFGVMVAWVWTVTFIPAFVMFIPEKRLAGFGAVHHGEEGEPRTLIAKLLVRTGRFTYRRAKLLLAVVMILAIISGYGISRININDNPIRWFESGHPIRVADRVLNSHFGGTYMAYLALSAPEREMMPGEAADEIVARLNAWRKEAPGQYDRRIASLRKDLESAAEADKEFIRDDIDYANKQKEAFEANASPVFDETKQQIMKARDQASMWSLVSDYEKGILTMSKDWADNQLAAASAQAKPAWDSVQLFFSAELQRNEVFKRPDVLAWIERLQKDLLGVKSVQGTDLVGKSNSLADIVTTVNRDLRSGEEKDRKLPDSAAGVAQALDQFMSSHRPGDLWHFVTRNYRKSIVWVQLKSGDNRDMVQVVDAVKKFVADNPPPVALEAKWFGLTYINVEWQQKMVSGMLQAFLGSFLAVFLMMTLLYRSALWGLLCMVPLTVTIGFIYGLIGLVGKDYDMPVAVLSSLSLGLAVDYSIHFLTRSRMLYEKYRSWKETAGTVFGEPARAITRNVIVIGVGFLPLILAPLVPYQTVGYLIAAILFAAGFATLLILPALITVLERRLFPRTRVCCLACNFFTIFISGVTLVALVAVNVHQFLGVGWTPLTLVGIGAIVVIAIVSHLFARRDKCKVVFLEDEGKAARAAEGE